MKQLSKKIIVVIESIFATIAMSLFLGYSSINLFPVVLFILIYFFFVNVTRKRTIYSLLIGVLILLIFIIPGKYLSYYYDNTELYTTVIKLLFILAGGTILFSYIVEYLFEIFDKKKIKPELNKKPFYIFLIAFIVIFPSWLILLICEYPGPLVPDTLYSFRQIFKETPFTNYDSIVYTFYLKFLMNVALLFVSDMTSVVFVMSIIQTIIHALVHSYICYYIYKNTNNKIVTLLAIIFYAFISYNSNYNIMLFKDSTFGLFTELLLIFIIKMNVERTRLNTVLFVIVSILFCLLRNNGIYAYLISMFFFLVYQCFKGFNKKKCLIYVIPLVISFIVLKLFIPSFINSLNRQNGLVEITNTTVNDYQYTKEDIYFLNEDNSQYNFNPFNKFIGNIIIHAPVELPLQEIGNVVYKGRELTEEESWLIEQRCPIEVIKSVYDINILDPIFKAVRTYTKPVNSSVSGYRYVMFWFELFKKYPQDYLEAYINMTRCYTYPNRYVDNLIFNVSDNEYGIKQQNLVSSSTKTFVEDFLHNQHNVRLIGYVFSPGLIMIILFILYAYGIYKKNVDLLFSYGCLIGLWITIMIACPCADCFRYIYPVVLSLPLILLSVFSLKEKN